MDKDKKVIPMRKELVPREAFEMWQSMTEEERFAFLQWQLAEFGMRLDELESRILAIEEGD